MLSFMKASVIFSPFLFLRMQASYYFLTTGSQVTHLERTLQGREGARVCPGPVSRIAAVGPDFAHPIVFELESRLWH